MFLNIYINGVQSTVAGEVNNLLTSCQYSKMSGPKWYEGIQDMVSPLHD